MKSKSDFIGQISLFDCFQDDQIFQSQLHGNDLTDQDNDNMAADATSAAIVDRLETKEKMDTAKKTISKEDTLAVDDVIWSCYGDYNGNRDAKAYVITDITNKGYMAQMLGQDCIAKKMALTMKSEGIAWARSREEAEKIKL